MYNIIAQRSGCKYLVAVTSNPEEYYVSKGIVEEEHESGLILHVDKKSNTYYQAEEIKEKEFFIPIKLG